jgi:GWxTD domain-containing protein
MTRLLCLFTFLSLVAHGQDLRQMNLKHWYDPEFLSFRIQPVRGAGQWTCYYALDTRDTLQNINDVQLTWEIRKSLNDKEGTPIAAENIVREEGSSPVRGKVAVAASNEVQYIVARATIPGNLRSFFYYAMLEPNYPQSRALASNGIPVVQRYTKVNTPLTVEGDDTYFVARYDDNFPTAPLAFSEALGKVARQMKVDSTFQITGGQPFSLSKTGLYLIQKDTTAAEGIAFRAEADYPRYAKLKNLAPPLVYICTNQEFERIKMADGEKKAFDKVILGITKDAERAKRLMKSYFKRVEYANTFFTSYKEGWKTDRGMIYIIYGQPDEVFRSADREVWNYRQPEYKVTFNFARSPSIFDPENFVLIRERKYQELWYEVIDLWRNARF